MLVRGRDRLLDEGLVGNVATEQANAERLPFASNTFDCITIGFGLRNVTDKAAALASMSQGTKAWRDSCWCSSSRTRGCRA